MMALFDTRIGLASLLALIGLNVVASVLPYKDSDQTHEQRLADLLPRMTLEEKIGQMSQYVGINLLAQSEKI